MVIRSTRPPSRPQSPFDVKVATEADVPGLDGASAAAQCWYDTLCNGAVVTVESTGNTYRKESLATYAQGGRIAWFQVGAAVHRDTVAKLDALAAEVQRLRTAVESPPAPERPTAVDTASPPCAIGTITARQELWLRVNASFLAGEPLPAGTRLDVLDVTSQTNGTSRLYRVRVSAVQETTAARPLAGRSGYAMLSAADVSQCVSAPTSESPPAAERTTAVSDDVQKEAERVFGPCSVTCERHANIPELWVAVVREGDTKLHTQRASGTSDGATRALLDALRAMPSRDAGPPAAPAALYGIASFPDLPTANGTAALNPYSAWAAGGVGALKSTTQPTEQSWALDDGKHRVSITVAEMIDVLEYVKQQRATAGVLTDGVRTVSIAEAVDGVEYMKHLQAKAYANRPSVQHKEHTMPTPDKSPVLKTLEADATDAAWRLAGNQFVKLAKEPLVALLSRHLGPDDESLRGRIATFLDTELGTALLKALFSAGLSAIPAPAGSQAAIINGRLARELRVDAMANVGDLIAEVIMAPMRQVAVMYLQGVPVGPAGLPDVSQGRVSVADAIGVTVPA